MGWKCWFAMTCDTPDCGAVGPQRLSGDDPDAEAAAVSEGWQVAKSLYRCPQHRCPACVAAGRRPEHWSEEEAIT